MNDHGGVGRRKDGYAKGVMNRSPGSQFIAPIDPRIHPAYYYGGKPEVRFNDKSSPFSALYWRQHFDKVDHERYLRFDQGRDVDEEIV